LVFLVQRVALFRLTLNQYNESTWCCLARRTVLSCTGFSTCLLRFIGKVLSSEKNKAGIKLEASSQTSQDWYIYSTDAQTQNKVGTHRYVSLKVVVPR